MIRIRTSSLVLLLAVTATGVSLAQSNARTPLHDRVIAALQARAADFVALRHDLHRHPEVSGAEERTARVVAERMRALGLEVRTGVGGHGVVAVLRGGRPGPLVAYRADMDAVRSNDDDPAEFRSVVPGVRHQCGHDVHTAIAVSLATAFAAVRADLGGSIMFIFQPAEEQAAGAKAMLADGVFASDKPVAIYGIHTAPYEVGVIGTRPGVMMAARDGLTITLIGKGNLKAAEAAARRAAERASTITREQSMGPAPEDFSFVQLGPTTSPFGSVSIRGSVTLASAAARERARQTIAKELAAIDLPDVKVHHEYEPRRIAGVTNDPALTTRAVASLSTALGAAAVQPVQNILPAFSEDFGSFQDEVPGVFFFLGVSNAAKGVSGMPHTANYAADDAAIQFGARAMTAVLVDRLAGK